MKGKQIWAAGLAALTLSLSLTGCGTNDNATPTPRSMPNAAYYASEDGAVRQRSQGDVYKRQQLRQFAVLKSFP